MAVNYEHRTAFDPNAIPQRSRVGVLSGDFEEGKSGKVGEGATIILSDGEEVHWQPPPAKPCIPDYSTVKRVQHYFNRVGYQVYPSWLYHPTQEPRIVKDAKEAMELGVFYRETTLDERMAGMKDHRWDWSPSTLWRPQPYPKGSRVFDPNKPEGGKSYEPPRPDYQQAQHDMLAALVAGLGNLKGVAGAGQITPEVLAQAMVIAMQSAAPVQAPAAAEPSAQPADPGDDEGTERALWLDEAERLGVHVDGRWGLERLKAEVAKANARAD